MKRQQAQKLVRGEALLQEKKTPLVIGEYRTQVLANSMVIAASGLTHCATYMRLNQSGPALTSIKI